jgi:hypothetical protein
VHRRARTSEELVIRMRRRLTPKQIAFLVSGAVFIACAADPGDVLKLGETAPTNSGTSTGTGTGNPATDGNTGVSSSTDTGSTSPTVTNTGTSTGTTTENTTDTTTGTGTGTGTSTGTTTQNTTGSTTGTGTGTESTTSTTTTSSTSTMSMVVGAGCAAGATVIVLTISSGTNGNTGNFGTTGPVCVELMGSVNQGWGISNGGSRMVTVTSSSGTAGPVAADSATLSPPLPAAPKAGADGFVYWNFTADTTNINYASVYVF